MSEDGVENYFTDPAAEALARQSIKKVSTKRGGPFWQTLMEVTFAEEGSSDLGPTEVWRLYNAVAFGMWQFGPAGQLNTHITILWEDIGVTNHQHAAWLLGEYLNEAEKWAGRGGPYTRAGQRRARRRARTGEEFPFYWIYTHENGGQAGFHSHILASVLPATLPTFKAWTRNALRRLAGGTLTTERTVKIVPGNSVKRTWGWYKYLVKQLAETAQIQFTLGAPRPMREVLRCRWKRSSWPVTCEKLSGSCRALDYSARRAAGFRSALDLGHFADLYTDHELSHWHLQQTLKDYGLRPDDR